MYLTLMTENGQLLLMAGIASLLWHTGRTKNALQKSWPFSLIKVRYIFPCNFFVNKPFSIIFGDYESWDLALSRFFENFLVRALTGPWQSNEDEISDPKRWDQVFGPKNEDFIRNNALPLIEIVFSKKYLYKVSAHKFWRESKRAHSGSDGLLKEPLYSGSQLSLDLSRLLWVLVNRVSPLFRIYEK